MDGPEEEVWIHRDGSRQSSGRIIDGKTRQFFGGGPSLDVLKDRGKTTEKSGEKKGTKNGPELCSLA